MMNNKPEVKIQKTNLPFTTDANNNKKKTLRDYMREYVGR